MLDNAAFDISLLPQGLMDQLLEFLVVAQQICLFLTKVWQESLHIRSEFVKIKRNDLACKRRLTLVAFAISIRCLSSCWCLPRSITCSAMAWLWASAFTNQQC